MNFSIKITISIVIAALLYGVILLDKHIENKDEKIKTESKKIFSDLSLNKVLKFEIHLDNNKFIFNRKDNESDWKIISPLNVSANQSIVNSALDSVEDYKIISKIENPEDLSIFGLDNKAKTKIIIYQDNDKKELILGDKLHIENQGIYAKTSDDNVFVVDNNILKSIEKKWKDFRSLDGANVDFDKIYSIEIKDGKDPIVLKNQNPWKIITKKGIVIAGNHITAGYAEKISTFTVSEVIVEQPSEVEIKKYGLDNPSKIIKVNDEEGSLLFEYKISNIKDKFYFLTYENTIAEISKDKIKEYFPNLEYFRDKGVLSGIPVAEINSVTVNGKEYIQKDSGWFEKDTNIKNDKISSFMSEINFLTADKVHDFVEEDSLNKFNIANGTKVKITWLEEDVENLSSFIFFKNKEEYFIYRKPNTVYEVLNKKPFEIIDELIK